MNKGFLFLPAILGAFIATAALGSRWLIFSPLVLPLIILFLGLIRLPFFARFFAAAIAGVFFDAWSLLPAGSYVVMFFCEAILAGALRRFILPDRSWFLSFSAIAAMIALFFVIMPAITLWIGVIPGR